MWFPFIQILLASCSVAYALLIFIYRYHWLRIPLIGSAGSDLNTPVSVIIPMRNESLRIIQCLESVAAQDYPVNLTEVILVDDFSEDHTAGIVEQWIAGHDQHAFRVLSLKEFVEKEQASKKAALHVAVKEARGEIIITTDADCRMGPKWISSMVSFIKSTKASFVSGPVELSGQKWFDGIQSLEFMSLIGSGAASVFSGEPLMCNGANLAFLRKEYLSSRNHEMSTEPATGDDTFLMLDIWKKNPFSVNFIKSREAIVVTEAAASVREFINQRKRWASKVKHYRLPHITFAGIVVWSASIAILISGIAALMNREWLPVFLFCLSCRVIPDFLFLFSITGFFRKRRWLVFFLLVLMLHIIYIPLITMLSMANGYQWKGRRFRK